MRKKLVMTGMVTIITFFLLFYSITVFLLETKFDKREKPVNNEIVDKIPENDKNSEEIIKNLYKDVKILYDVVNNKFKVNQEDTITSNDLTYKRITNFEEVMNDLFTDNGIKKYLNDLKQYFAYTETGYYLAGSLVSYQTYYFRGDNTNIYILDSSDTEINAIIYEVWTNNNTSTLATIKVIKENNKWLVDNINILYNQ